MKRFLLVIITHWLICLSALAQKDTLSQCVTLSGVEVDGKYNRSGLSTSVNGTLSWDMLKIQELPKILGYSDPVHYAQMLPGVQTNGEYRGGINIQGCENSHNEVSINGVPLYNVNHLLGFFSTFNASHYASMSLTKSVQSSGFPNRLGGQLMMSLPDSIDDKFNGEFSIGLISSQGTLRIPLGSKTSLFVSGRVSYINLLYSSWLNSPEAKVNYSFYDANVTLVHNLNRQNSLVVDYYGGNDHAKMYEGDYAANVRGKWGNTAVAVHHNYRRESGLRLSQSLYYTNYKNREELDLQAMSFALPSDVYDIGYKGSVQKSGWTAGLSLTYHHIKPQSIKTWGTVVQKDAEAVRQQSFEGSAWVDYKWQVSRYSDINLGLRGSVYALRNDRTYGAVDPTIGYSYSSAYWQLSLQYSMRHQYLYQTGFSETGLPSEFWFSADRNHKPQYAHSLSASIATYLFGGRYKLSVDGYYKRLYNQVEYIGSVLDFANKSYNIEDNLIQGRGENWGASVLLNKTAGALTGWISYSYTHARRTYHEADIDGTFHANHERPHEVNAVATYAIGKHWDVGGTFVYASGTPFTAQSKMLMLNGNIISQFREYNSARLPAYCRLDLSANYKWKDRKNRNHGVNLSLYNAMCNKNYLFYYNSVNEEYLQYKPMSFIIRILPSVSYFCKF